MRELVILLLGLAIVGVILRGIFVALKSRRGQIKLAIDKNIPQDIDLDAMEMSELPGGGARVVVRSLNEVNRLNVQANARAEALDLGRDNFDHNAVSESVTADVDNSALSESVDYSTNVIPVLMDVVELSEQLTPTADKPSELSGTTVSRAQHQDPAADYGQSTQTEPATDVAVESIWAAGEAASSDNSPSEEDSFTASDIDSNELGAIEDNSWQERAEPTIDFSSDHRSNERSSIGPSSSDELGPDLVTAQLDDGDQDPISQVAQNYSADEELDDSGQDFNSQEPASQTFAPQSREQDSALASVRDSDQDSLFDTPNEADYPQAISEAADHEQELLQPSQPQHDELREQPAETGTDLGLDEFAMTAGDRIGGLASSASPTVDPASSTSAREAKSGQHHASNQSELFDDAEPSVKAKANSTSTKPSFFSNLKSRFTSKDLNTPVEKIQQDRQFDLEELDAQADLVELEKPAEPVSQPRESAPAAEATKPQPDIDYANEPTEVIILNVMAKQGYVIHGNDLLQMLITSGLKFGEMNIFHHRLEQGNKAKVIFSVANIVNPGTFDLNNMDEFTTKGVSFFLALPSVINNLQAFEEMLAIAQQIRGALNCDLRDEQRNLMTAQTIEHYRQRIRDFELQLLKASRSQS